MVFRNSEQFLPVSQSGHGFGFTGRWLLALTLGAAIGHQALVFTILSLSSFTDSQRSLWDLIPGGPRGRWGVTSAGHTVLSAFPSALFLLSLLDS